MRYVSERQIIKAAEPYLGAISFLMFVHMLAQNVGGVKQVIEMLTNGSRYSPQADGDDGRYFA